MSATQELPDVMTAKELAAYLKLSDKYGYQTIAKMARQGKIKGTRIGDLWRFTRAQVEAILVGKHDTRRS